MSLTGLDLRRRLRRRLARGLEALAAHLDTPTEPSWAPPPPTAEPARPAEPPRPPEPAPAPVSPPKTALPPLPAIEKPTATKAPARKAPKAPTPAPAPTASDTPAAAKAKESPEDRQRKHWERTRLGLLRFVHEGGGKASLRDLHEHSEKTYFVAHVGFSRMMEELTDQGLLHYDHDTALASITDAGRAELD